MKDIEISQAVHADCPGIAALGRSIWGDDANGEPLSHQLIDLGYPLFVAKDGAGAVAGYVSCLVRVDASAAHILSITLHPDYRRKGLGTRLVGRAVEFFRAQKARGITAMVSAENAASRALFGKLGFQIAREMRHYYEPGDLYYEFHLPCP